MIETDRTILKIMLEKQFSNYWARDIKAGMGCYQSTMPFFC